MFAGQCFYLDVIAMLGKPVADWRRGMPRERFANSCASEVPRASEAVLKKAVYRIYRRITFSL